LSSWCWFFLDEHAGRTKRRNKKKVPGEYGIIAGCGLVELFTRSVSFYASPTSPTCGGRDAGRVPAFFSLILLAGFSFIGSGEHIYIRHSAHSHSRPGAKIGRYR
jgi:hypothetical protein